MNPQPTLGRRKRVPSAQGGVERRHCMYLPKGLLAGFALIVLAAPAVVRGAAKPPDFQQSSVSRYRSFVFSQVVRVLPSSNRLELRIPLPSTDIYQTISELRIDAPGKVRLRDNKKTGESYEEVVLEPSHAEAPRDVRLTFRVVRYGRAIPADRETGTSNAMVGQTEVSADPIAKAQAAYKQAASRLRADKTQLTQNPDAPSARVDGKDQAENQGFADLFVALARSAGLPARIVVGFSLPGARAGTVSGYREWPEFYVDGLGWIPAESALSAATPEERGVELEEAEVDHLALYAVKNIPCDENSAHGIGSLPLRSGLNAVIETEFFFQDSQTAADGLRRKTTFADGAFILPIRPRFSS